MSPAPPPATTRSRPNRTVSRPLRASAAGALIAVLAVLALAADQFTKQLSLASLPWQEPVRFWPGVLEWYSTTNPGAAFSLGGSAFTWLFTILLACAATTVIVIAFRGVRSRLWAVALGLLLGGILGNLTDRLFRDPGFPVGHVVDFINTPWMWFGMNPAIYNLADVFIVSMMISVALLVLIGIRLDGTREPRAKDADAESEPADADTASSTESSSLER